MCLACFAMSCTGATGCDEEPFGGISPAALTEVRDYTALLAYAEYPSARWNAVMPTVGAQVFVTYSFTEPGAIPSVEDYNPYDATGYWSFDATQRESTRAAMAELSRVSGVIFVETTGEEAMLQVFRASGSSYGGWANYPWVSEFGANTGRMVIDMEGSFAPGTSAFQVILHELGHAVGLKHPFDGNVRLAADLDNTSQTLMSYSWSGGARSQFSPLDVEALQHLYGEARANAGWSWALVSGVFTLTAGLDADVVIGVRTENRLMGRAGADQMFGAALNDTLIGDFGNDTLSGGYGDDRLFGGVGRDSLSGGRGNDDLRGNDGNDTLTGGEGSDTLRGDAGNDRIFGDEPGDVWGFADLIYGGEGDDTITGTGSDTMYGDAGNDRLFAGHGSNRLFGGAGDDTIHGGDSGHMLIRGGDGNDLIYGQTPGATFAGWDTLDGGAGHDTLHGGAGSDSLSGANGNDLLFGGTGWDTLTGGAGDDRLFGGSDRDALHGGIGRDTLSGGEGTDRLEGGAGADVLTGGVGAQDDFLFTAADFGTIDLITDFEIGLDRILMQDLGFLRSGLGIADHANGRDSLLTAGPAGELTIRIAGIRAADFDLWDVWL